MTSPTWLAGFAEKIDSGEVEPECDYVDVTVRVPVDRYFRIETVVNARAAGRTVRGSNEACVDAIRKIADRLPKACVISYVHGQYDGLRGDTPALVEAAKARVLVVQYCDDPNCVKCGA